MKADDGSFTSGPPADAWTYQRVFSDTGEILHNCEVHGAPGMDINTFMNGRITVQAESETEFDINAGLNDAWYNPATDGLLTYEITTIERSGEIPIQRIVSDNVSLCESLAAP